MAKHIVLQLKTIGILIHLFLLDTGLNVFIQSGAGSTSSYGTTPNGLGNLFVGYNTDRKAQTGSHNLVKLYMLPKNIWHE